MTKTLDDRITFALNYCQQHKINKLRTQNFLTDAFNRYLLDHKTIGPKTPLLAIQEYYLNTKHQEAFKNIIKKHNLSVTETNRLLLIMCITKSMYCD
jgi:hypothetical protein